MLPLWFFLCRSVLLAVVVKKNVAAAWVVETIHPLRPRALPTTHLKIALFDHDNDTTTSKYHYGSVPMSIGRRRSLQVPVVLLAGTFVTTTTTTPPPVHALFDGGIGGLGKTRPETGVVFVDTDAAPLEQTASGIVSAELLVDATAGTVALVSFQSPWPLLGTSSGLETRDLVTTDAAFCQVVSGNNRGGSGVGAFQKAATPKEAAAALKKILQESVLATQGKFGMYGAPSSIKVKPFDVDDASLFQLTFTALTPAMRESDRKYYVSVRTVANNGVLVLLLVGTTAARFASQEAVMRKVAQSWQVVQAPQKAMRR